MDAVLLCDDCNTTYLDDTCCNCKVSRCPKCARRANVSRCPGGCKRLACNKCGVECNYASWCRVCYNTQCLHRVAVKKQRPKTI